MDFTGRFGQNNGIAVPRTPHVTVTGVMGAEAEVGRQQWDVHW
eukprot:COSAG02_NODE_4362_length_5449_cov_17.248785_2_plen_43_part_00